MNEKILEARMACWTRVYAAALHAAMTRPELHHNKPSEVAASKAQLALERFDSLFGTQQ